LLIATLEKMVNVEAMTVNPAKVYAFVCCLVQINAHHDTPLLARLHTECQVERIIKRCRG
jgi:hypothetical protein